MDVQKSPDVWLIKDSDSPISTLPRFLILYLNIEERELKLCADFFLQIF